MIRANKLSTAQSCGAGSVLVLLSLASVVRRCDSAGRNGMLDWSPGERYDTTSVRRADLFPIRTASGRVESGKRTIIECQLENIAVGVRGQRLTAAGASVLLSVIPEGSVVKRGDVLAVLDSSDYEELLRLQKITLERATADKLQADLNVEIAKLAVREFQEGTVAGDDPGLRGQDRSWLAADLERAIDRLNWSRRMNDKGYIPAAVVTSDEFRRIRWRRRPDGNKSRPTLCSRNTRPPRPSRSSKARCKGPGPLSNIKSFVSIAILTGWPRSRSKWKTARSARRTTASSSTPITPTASCSSSPACPCDERAAALLLAGLERHGGRGHAA